jgi:hypothetical protein
MSAKGQKCLFLAFSVACSATVAPRGQFGKACPEGPYATLTAHLGIHLLQSAVLFSHILHFRDEGGIHAAKLGPPLNLNRKHMLGLDILTLFQL